MQAHPADEVGEGLVGNGPELAVESGPAHADLLTELADAEARVGQVGLDNGVQLPHELVFGAAVFLAKCMPGLKEETNIAVALLQLGAQFDEFVDPDSELTFIEGLGQVGVRPGEQAFDPGGDVRFSSEQDDGDVAGALVGIQLAAHFQAVHCRHQDVADDDVGDGLAGLGQALFAVVSCQEVKAGAQDDAQVFHHVPVVFDDEDGILLLAPDQTFENIDGLPILRMPPPAGGPSTIPWPDGDLIEDQPLPPGVDQAALAAASDWAFHQQSDKVITLSLIVVYKGQIILERYAPGIDVSTKTRAWSVSKSIASTLIGIAVDQGKLALDEPLGLEWLPQIASPETDPRAEITLRHVLNMASGLDPWEGPVQHYGAGAELAYFGGVSSVNLALSKGLVRKPGTVFNYDSHNTFLGVYALKKALGNPQTYLEFPRRALLGRIGMRNTILGVDRFGDFILSSQVYTNARDLARFGLLYLQNGIWNGERILSEEWIKFVRTPVPLPTGMGFPYGGHWWLPTDELASAFPDACTASGSRGQYIMVLPSRELVIVRRGMDYGWQRLDPVELIRKVAEAIQE